MTWPALIKLLAGHGYNYNTDSDLTLAQLRDFTINHLAMKKTDD